MNRYRTHDNESDNNQYLSKGGLLCVNTVGPLYQQYTHTSLSEYDPCSIESLLK